MSVFEDTTKQLKNKAKHKWQLNLKPQQQLCETMPRHDTQYQPPNMHIFCSIVFTMFSILV